MAHIQIRNVPPELHRKLKARAAEEGLTLSDYMLRRAERDAKVPTLEEAVRRIRSRKLARLKTPPAELIREDRDSR
jgi:plasmid stability protein